MIVKVGMDSLASLDDDRLRQRFQRYMTAENWSRVRSFPFKEFNCDSYLAWLLDSQARRRDMPAAAALRVTGVIVVVSARGVDD